jgi:hypothetical protein
VIHVTFGPGLQVHVAAEAVTLTVRTPPSASTAWLVGLTV